MIHFPVFVLLGTNGNSGLLGTSCERWKFCFSQFYEKFILFIQISNRSSEGEKGEQGLRGYDGRSGENGRDGLPGLKGERGPQVSFFWKNLFIQHFQLLFWWQGLPGLPGTGSNTNVAIRDGQKGERGEPGLVGLQGQRGETVSDDSRVSSAFTI